MSQSEVGGKDILSAPHVLEYPYRRSLGPVLSRFFTALRDRRIEGVRTRDGRVLVPPQEYDPDSGEALDELVPVASAGVVTTWAWVAEPRRKHPLDRPFAWALVRLDGADSALLHAVDAGDPSLMRTGMRVRARWRDATVGEIRDIVCFEPEGAGEKQGKPAAAATEGEAEPVKSIKSPIRLDYTFTPGRAPGRFLHGIAEGRILGQRCIRCGKVYVPPRGSCARCGVPTEEEVEVSGKGTVTTFCIVRIPSENLSIQPPFVCAHILLDGADIPFFGLIQECEFDKVRMGMRVEAVWIPRAEFTPSFENIKHFRPIDEPDAPYESFKEHL
jgi:hypothetical protein